MQHIYLFYQKMDIQMLLPNLILAAVVHVVNCQRKIDEQFLGCYNLDSAIDKAPYRGEVSTVDACIDHCVKDFRRSLKTFALIRAIRRTEVWCFCYDNVPWLLAPDCLPATYQHCHGDSSQICGGPSSNYISIYSACPKNKFGIDCERDCHCTGELGCHVAIGRCIRGLCIQGYTGSSCSEDLDECGSNPCLNGATCQDNPPPVNGYECTCAEGFMGSKCQLEVNECVSDPCLNGGICQDEVGRFSCLCPAGYSGVTCETDIDECFSNPCPNGICENHLGYYTCQCDPGFTGLSCETDIDDCASNPCVYGDCVDLTNSFTCHCDEGYTGTTCGTNIDECLSNPCVHDGKCLDLLGEYQCQCLDGFLGINCEIDVDECDSSPCQNNGTCIDEANHYQCMCVQGYAGVNCEIEVPACLSGPCSNGGICLPDTAAGYYCDCPAGYQGSLCQTMLRRMGAPDEGAMFNISAIILPIIAVLLLLIIVIAAFIYRHRKNNPSAAPPDQEDAEEILPTHKSIKRARKSWKESFVKRISRNPSVMVTSEMCPLQTLPQNQQTKKDDGAYGFLPPVKPSYTPVKKIGLEKISNYILEGKMNDMAILNEEYTAMKTKTTAGSCDYGRKLSLKSKNKYKDILPYDRTRVVLSRVDDEPNSDYINANWIHGFHTDDVFIACQGPWYTTLCDFWRMIWETEVPIIVMVTQFMELGKRKVEQYFPEAVGVDETYDDITIELLAEDVWLDYTIRSLNVSKDGESRLIRHFHFTAWPDHGVPNHGTALANFQRRVRAEMPPGIPIAIHCSAGVGRTGTYISLDQLLQQGERVGWVDVPGCVIHLREQRAHMVQTLPQYVFIYDALWEAFAVGDTVIKVEDFKTRFSSLRRKSLVSSHHLIQSQFEVLQMIQGNEKQPDCSHAESSENLGKNRKGSILPSNFKRVRLMTTGEDLSDYINAIVVDGYKKKNEFIATQTPLESTILDFWRMILDYKCRDIVLLTNNVVEGLIPDRRIPIKFGRYSVHLEAGEEDCGCKIFNMVIAKETKTKSRNVDAENDCDYVNIENLTVDKEPVVETRLVLVPLESEEEFCGPDFESLLMASNLVERRRLCKNNGPVVVMCDNASTWCGFYIGVSCLFEMIQTTQQVDIFSICKQIKTNRIQFIPSQGMYELLYDTANKYVARYNEVIQ